MRVKKFGKSILAVFLALALAVICAACGGSSEEAPADNTAPAAEYWVCTGLDMGDGEVMDAEAIQTLFQTSADSIISLRLREDGRAYVLYFGECISGT